MSPLLLNCYQCDALLLPQSRHIITRINVPEFFHNNFWGMKETPYLALIYIPIRQFPVVNDNSVVITQRLLFVLYDRKQLMVILDALGRVVCLCLALASFRLIPSQKFQRLTTIVFCVTYMWDMWSRYIVALIMYNTRITLHTIALGIIKLLDAGELHSYYCIPCTKEYIFFNSIFFDILLVIVIFLSLSQLICLICCNLPSTFSFRKRGETLNLVASVLASLWKILLISFSTVKNIHIFVFYFFILYQYKDIFFK